MAPQSAPAALDTGNSWVLDSGSPRPPSSVNSACFLDKMAPEVARSRRGLSLPVPISPFAARFGGGMALAPSQWPRADRNGGPIADGYPRI